MNNIKYRIIKNLTNKHNLSSITQKEFVSSIFVEDKPETTLKNAISKCGSDVCVVYAENAMWLIKYTLYGYMYVSVFISNDIYLSEIMYSSIVMSQNVNKKTAFKIFEDVRKNLKDYKSL